jgi:hypothetical protein
MSIKRTYSHRNMTMAPSAYSSPPEDNDTSSSTKRRKASIWDEAVTESRSMSSAKSARQKPPAKRFGGPVSMLYDESGVNEVPPGRDLTRDPFARVYNECKAGIVTPAQNVGSLHGSRKAFDTLVARKPSTSQLRHGGDAGVTALGESSETMYEGIRKSAKHVTIRPTLKTAVLPDPEKVLAHKMEVLAVAKGAFETTEYQSFSSSPPSTDLYRKHLDAHSKEATL